MAPLERFVIPNAHGEQLVGLLHETGSKEIVVLCHGFRCTKESPTIENLAAAISQQGISVFRFDFAGNGESEGSFQYANYWKEVEDLKAVTQHFTGQNRVISAVIGHSKGANIVLLYASKYRDVQKVVNISGRFNMKKGIRGRLGKRFLERIKNNGMIEVRNSAGEVEYLVSEESLIERININMHEACRLIDEQCRVLTIHGSADSTVSIKDALEFSKIMLKNHELRVIEGTGHGYSSKQIELASAVLSFINKI